MLEEKEGIIEGLRKRIVEARRSEKDLERCLAEAENRIEERDRHQDISDYNRCKGPRTSAAS